MGRPPLPSLQTSLEPFLEGRRHRTPQGPLHRWLPVYNFRDSKHPSLAIGTSVDSSSLLLTAMWTESCVPYRILLWAAVNEMNKSEGTWGRDDRRQSLRGGKQRTVQGGRYSKKGTQIPERACVNEDSTLSSRGRVTCWAPWPQFMMHEGKGSQCFSLGK